MTPFFFRFRSNFRAITRLETLATQATTRDMCRPVFQILTLFQTKKCNFSHPFSDPASKPLKSTPVFRHIHIWLIREYPPTPPRSVLYPVYLSYLCQSLFFVKLQEVSTSKIQGSYSSSLNLKIGQQLLSPVQTDATLLDVSYCVRLDGHVACCWELFCKF